MLLHLSRSTANASGRAATQRDLCITHQAIEHLPGPLGQTGGGLVATGQGLLSATKAALAFIATPLGLALAAIAAAFYVVKEALTATDEGQEDLAAGSAALGAVLNVLKGTVIEAGKFIVKLFTDPKQAGEDLLDFIESQLINRIKAYGVIWEGIRNGDFKQVLNGLAQQATGVENVIGKTKALAEETRRAAEAAASISRAKDQLEDLEIAAIARTEKQRQLAEKLLLSARDRNLTEKQRLANLDEASRLEKDNLDRNLHLERERYAILLLQNAEAVRRGTLQDDDRRAAEQQLAKLAQLQGEYEKQEQVRDNRRATLQADEAQKRAAAAKQASDARTKALEDEIRGRQAATQAQLLTVQQGSARELELQEQLVAQKAELEAAGAKKTAAERKLIVATSYAELLKLEDDFLQKREAAATAFLAKGDAERIVALNAEKKREADAAKEKEDAYKQDEAMLERYLNRRSTEIENNYAEGKIQKAEYERELRILEESNYGGRIALQKVYNKDTSKLEAEQAAKHRGVLVATREAEKKLNDDRLKNAEQLGQEVGQLFADVLLTQGESLQEFTGKLILLLIDSLEKVTLAAAAEASAKSIAMNPTPAGFLQAAVTSALIVAGFETAKGIITATTAKPFAANTGGIVPGYGNTDTVPAILTPGEVVMNKAASAELAPVLSYLNSLYGGANFAPGFTPTQSASRSFDGGLMARQIGSGQQIDYQKLADAMSEVHLDVGVRTIDRAKQQYNRPRALARLGG